MRFGSAVACSVTVLLGELTLHARDRLFVYFRVMVDGGGRERGKVINLYYPSLLPLLPSPFPLFSCPFCLIQKLDGSHFWGSKV